MKVGNHTFIVSGGSSGLGLATVQNLHGAGAFVAILDLKEPEQNALNTQKDKRLKFIQLDITEVNNVAAAVEASAAWAKETGALLRGVINCAGVGSASKIIDANNEPHPLNLWNFVVAVNLTGSFNLSRLALKHLVNTPPEGPDSERGIIIFVSSSAAFEGQIGQTAYSATKGALASMTLPMARDLGRHGIRVNTIAPGAFASPMTAQMPQKTTTALERELIFPRRMGRADEFASTARWLIECGYMNGDVVRLSGAARLPVRL